MDIWGFNIFLFLHLVLCNGKAVLEDSQDGYGGSFQYSYNPEPEIQYPPTYDQLDYFNRPQNEYYHPPVHRQQSLVPPRADSTNEDLLRQFYGQGNFYHNKMPQIPSYQQAPQAWPNPQATSNEYTRNEEMQYLSKVENPPYQNNEYSNLPSSNLQYFKPNTPNVDYVNPAELESSYAKPNADAANYVEPVILGETYSEQYEVTTHSSINKIAPEKVKEKSKTVPKKEKAKVGKKKVKPLKNSKKQKSTKKPIKTTGKVYTSKELEYVTPVVLDTKTHVKKHGSIYHDESSKDSNYELTECIEEQYELNDSEMPHEKLQKCSSKKQDLIDETPAKVEQKESDNYGNSKNSIEKAKPPKPTHMKDGIDKLPEKYKNKPHESKPLPVKDSTHESPDKPKPVPVEDSVYPLPSQQGKDKPDKTVPGKDKLPEKKDKESKPLTQKPPKKSKDKPEKVPPKKEWDHDKKKQESQPNLQSGKPEIHFQQEDEKDVDKNENGAGKIFSENGVNRGFISVLDSSMWSLLFNPNANTETFKKCITRNNESGNCRYIQHCSIPNVANSFESLLSNACVIDDVFIGVCCPEFPVETVKVHWENELNPEGGTEDELKQTFEDCGIRSDEAIEGDLWPWKAPLVSMSNGKLFCGGIIVNEEYILTAAHCTTKIPKNQILVRIGQHDENSGEDYAVTEIKRHAQYNSRTMQNDIALLKLARRIPVSDNVDVICLPDEDDGDDRNDHSGDKGILLGWHGFIGKQEDKVESLEIISDEECKKRMGNGFTKTLLCTEPRRQDERACNADSGAPLIMEDDGKHEVIGILSWNRNDCDQRFPSTFSRISKYVKWIKKHAF